MGLPDSVEIIPLTKPVSASVVVPGSKSVTNRAMILAALGDGTTHLRGALWSEDTQVMTECLRTLGFEVVVEADPFESSNRTISITGLGGRIPHSGTAASPLELYVANAGTAARFLAALVCLGQGVYRLHGSPRMHVRPQASLFASLRQLGYRIDGTDDRLPAVIHGSGPKPGRCIVSIEESSQFASALLLSGIIGGWRIEIMGENSDESPYVWMTSELRSNFPRYGGEVFIEPDASGGSYFWATRAFGHDVRVAHWPESGWQIDAEFPRVMFGTSLDNPSPANRFAPPSSISRLHDLGDSIMTAVVLGALATQPVRFTELGRLRVQECERVQALRDELTKCGAQVQEIGDTLEIRPSKLHGAAIETYDDHRMAMCFAILGLKVPAIIIKNPACVKKTFPNFFLKLAAHPPAGLGVTIVDAVTRRPLVDGELVAE